MKILVFVVLLLSRGLFAQNLVDYSSSEMNWAKWDKMYDDNNAKLDFIRSVHFEYPDDNGNTNSLTPAYMKIVDVDGDGIHDLFYVEPGAFQLYINKNDTLHMVSSENQQIEELSRTWPDAPLNFKTSDYSCCKGEEWEFNYFQFYIDDHLFSYRIYRTEIIAQGTKDLFHNMPPTQIKVGASTADLVLGPGSPDAIKSYTTGAKGYAVASMKDENGTLWWKVFIKENNYKLRAGWIERNKLVPVYQSR